MNKRILSLVCALVLLVASGNVSNATTIYQENMELNEMINEDVTVAVGGTVYNEKGVIYGLSEGEGGYVENLVPLSDTSYDQRAINALGNMPQYVSLNSSKEKGTYTPTDDICIFSWSSKNKAELTTISFDIIDTKTGSVIARAYNVKSDVQYVSAYNLKNNKLEFKVIDTVDNNNDVILSISSIANENAKKMYTNQEFSGVATKGLFSTTTTYTTGTVPKNINGNQGQVMFTHTVTGNSGHRRVNTKHSSSTNGQLSVNVALDYAGIQQGFVMCLNVGSTFSLAQSFPVGADIDFRISTNSANQGAATMKVTDTILW